MEGDFDEIDVGIDDAGGDVAVAEAPEQETEEPGEVDNYTALQDRMQGDDSPWYSASEGKVVDKDGEVLIDPKTNQPFRSMEDFERWQAKNAQATEQNTATPKTNTNTQTTAPVSKSFDALVGIDSGLTPEKLYAFGKVGSDYQYNDSLIPRIDPNVAQANGQQNLDPIEQVRTMRSNIEASTVQPLRELRDVLIANGAPEGVTDQILAPFLKKQTDMVEKLYQDNLEKAMLEKMDGKYAPALNKFEQDKLTSEAFANTNALAQKYYPQGGKEAFFALINGHPTADGQFKRGESAPVLDLMAHLVNGDKAFPTEQARNESYKSMFEKTMANPEASKLLVDIAHYYWLGKQSHKSQAMVYEKGKAAAQKQQQTVQKTIRTKPGSFSAPADANDDEGMPSLLRDVISSRR